MSIRLKHYQAQAEAAKRLNHYRALAEGAEGCACWTMWDHDLCLCDCHKVES